MLPKNTSKYLFRCGLITLSLCSSATNANFELTKTIEIGATTTDNLKAEDAEELRENELIFNIKPSVGLKFSGNRFGVAALAEAEYFKFNNNEESVIDPRFFMTARGTLVDNLLYLDSELVLAKLSSDGLFPRSAEKVDTAAQSNTKLYLDHSFGQVADVYTGYSFSTIAERAGESFDSSKHTVDFRIRRNPRFGGFLWGIGGLQSRDESKTSEFEEANLYGMLGASISQTLIAEFTYGIENSKLINGVDTINPVTTEFGNTSFWKADLNWSPNELTAFSVGYEDRKLGSGPTMLLQHRVRRSSILASYARYITRQAATLNAISPLGDNIAPTITDTDTVSIDNINNDTPVNEPFVDNRFQLTYKLAGRRSDIIVDAVYSNQEPLSGNDTRKSLLGRLVFDRELSDFLNLRLQYEYLKSKAPVRPNFNFEENRFSIKFIYNFDGNKQFTEENLEDNLEDNLEIQ